ncbi:MFS transporter [Piscinibacter sp.]|uniref:MFS transporter n=1 Tax=Piscinibacter sp. TaxID=1903157 RepID=UPI00355A5699
MTAFASGMSLRINDALLPKLVSEFGVSLGTAAQVVSLFATAYGLAQLFFGPVGDRFGKYRVIGWAAAACAATAAGCAAAPGFDSLRIARALAGATAAAVIPLSMAWIGDVVPYEQRQPVLARFLIGQIVGLTTGVWLGGFAADHFSWRAPYIVIAVLFAAMSVALLTLDRMLPPDARVMKLANGSALQRVVSEFASVLSRPWARVILGLVFLEGMCLYGPFAFIASHVHHVFGLSLSAAGALVMLFGLGGFVFAVLSSRLVGRLGEVGLARWGGALMSIALLAIGFAPAWQWALGGCFVLGLGFYMLHNTLQVNATQMAPDRRGAAVSAFAASFFLGQSAGVTLGGLCVGVIGTDRFLALGAVGVLCVAFAFVALQGRRGLVGALTAT